MRQLIGRAFWIGNAGDLRDPRALFSVGIEAVVELADNEPFAFLPRELVRLRFPLSDGSANPAWMLQLAVNTVAGLLKAGVPTLACCSCGMNRSVCVAAAGLALCDGRRLDDALLDVAKSGPADVAPGLLTQLRAVLGR